MNKETSSVELAFKAYQSILEAGKGWYLAVKDIAKGAPYLIDTTTAFLFTKEEYAINAAKTFGGMIPLEVCKMSGDGIGQFNNAMCHYGITKISVDMGQPHGGVGDRDEVLPVTNELYMGYRLANSKLYALMLSCLQSRKLSAPQITDDQWNALCEAFRSGLFFVPVYPQEELEKEIEEELKQAPYYYFTYYVSTIEACVKEHNVTMDRIPLWKVVCAEGKTLQFVSVSHPENGKQYIPIFTDLLEARAAVGWKTRLALITYEELKDAFACCDGMVINPANLNMVINAAGMESIAQTASLASDWRSCVEDGWNMQPEREVYKFIGREEVLRSVPIDTAPEETMEESDEDQQIVQIDDPLEHFGQVMMKAVRDWSIRQYDREIEYLEDNRYVKPILGGRKLNSTEKELLQAIVPDVVDTALHYMMFMFEQYPEFELTVGGENLNDISDGLAGELYTEDGWIMRFSKERYENY